MLRGPLRQCHLGGDLQGNARELDELRGVGEGNVPGRRKRVGKGPRMGSSPECLRN